MYAQTDSRWSKILLGFNKDANYDIGNFGCLITAYGNMLVKITGDESFTPEFMNTWLKDHAGFTPNGGAMYWTAPLGLGHVNAHGTAADLAATRAWVAADVNNYAIIQVTKPNTSIVHFVLMALAGQIVDSEDGTVKPDTTFEFVAAHLYQAASSAPAVEPAVTTNEELPMTAQEAIDAYAIVLGRAPDGPNDTRTAMQFIYDASAELTADRAKAAAQIAAAVAAEQAAQEQVGTLTSEVESLKSQPAPATVITPVDTITGPVVTEPVDFRSTETPFVGTNTAQQIGVVIDYAGVKPPLNVVPGTLFNFTSKFVVQGKTFYRTHTSATNGDWYGVDPALFTAPSLVVKFGLWASGAYGLLKRAETTLLKTVKPKGK